MNVLAIVGVATVFSIYMIMVSDHTRFMVQATQALYENKQRYYLCEGLLWYAIALYKQQGKTMVLPCTKAVAYELASNCTSSVRFFSETTGMVMIRAELYKEQKCWCAMSCRIKVYKEEIEIIEWNEKELFS